MNLIANVAFYSLVLGLIGLTAALFVKSTNLEYDLAVAEEPSSEINKPAGTDLRDLDEDQESFVPQSHS